MSTLHGKWSVEDVRKVMQSLDAKTGMTGASLPIHLCKSLKNGSALGTYRPSNVNKWRCFSFSLAYFDDDKFKDLAAIDVIRHEYCHYLVDALGLEAIFADNNDHGIAWKTVCGLLNADQHGTYRAWYFRSATEDAFRDAFMAKDIMSINITEQIDRWGMHLPSITMRKSMEKALVKKYTKVRVFTVNDRIVHNKFGCGVVLDTMPMTNKQLLYVQFNDCEPRIVQNRQVYKMVNGQIKKPIAKVR